MNGSLLAVLGVVVLLVIILVLKMRAGKSKPEGAPADEQVKRDELHEATLEAEGQDGGEPVVSPQAPEAVELETVVEEPIAEVAVQEEAELEAQVPEQAEPEPLLKEELPPPAESQAAVVTEPEPAEIAEEVVAVEEVGEVEEVIPEPLPEVEIEPLAEAIPPEAPVDEEISEKVEPATTEPEPEPEPIPEIPSEPEPAAESRVDQAEDTIAIPDLMPPAKPVEAALLLVRLSMEEYAEQLNALEEQQRISLAEAVAQNDDQRRDQLQRELVIMNDRLALLADQYVEEMACYQQVLDTLARFQTDEPTPALAQAIAELQTGKTGAAESFLDELSSQEHPLAVQAAFMRGQLAECRVDLQTAMACYRRAVAKEPDNPQYLRAAGLMARNLYTYKEALPWLESYVQITKESSQADAKTVALAQRELAYTYVLSGQYQKAGPLYKESMTVLAQKLGQEHPEMAVSWQQIGEFQETMGEYDKAVSLYKKALAILEKKRGAEHPALAGILRKLAALCVELELEPEAVPLYERLVRIQEKALRPTHPQLVISLNNLAEAYRLQGRYAEAEACYLKTLKINEEVHGKEHPGVAAVLQELAKLCTSQRKGEEAKQYQERASAIFQKSVEAAEKKAGEDALTLELS